MSARTLYIVRCSDGSLYTGIAKDLDARLRAHDEGKGARYTRGRGPVTLVFSRACETDGEARSLEMKVKRLSRAQKQQLVDGDDAWRAFLDDAVAAREAR